MTTVYPHPDVPTIMSWHAFRKVFDTHALRYLAAQGEASGWELINYVCAIMALPEWPVEQVQRGTFWGRAKKRLEHIAKNGEIKTIGVADTDGRRAKWITNQVFVLTPEGETGLHRGYIRSGALLPAHTSDGPITKIKTEQAPGARSEKAIEREKQVGATLSGLEATGQPIKGTFKPATLDDMGYLYALIKSGKVTVNIAYAVRLIEKDAE